MCNVKGVICLICLLFLLVPNTSKAATYTVTSANCDGFGSILLAIGLANANPGTDTITFAAGLTVDVSTCTPPGAIDPADYYLGHITESVIFEGNGVNIKGKLVWMNNSGTLNPKLACPLDVATTLVFWVAPGFIKIGTKHADNSGISVEIRNMKFESLTAFADVRNKASLSIESSSLWKIMDIYRDCGRPAILAWPGANVSVTSTTFEEIFTWSPVSAQVWTPIINSFPDSGDLDVMDSTFSDSPSGGSIAWSGGTANIVSSRFLLAGGINHGPFGTMNIVNSLFQIDENPGDYDRILAQSRTGPLNFIASSISIGAATCTLNCALAGNPFLVISPYAVSFRESAITVQFPTIHGQAFAALASGSYTADTLTWLQPVADQDATALRALFGQPALMTDPPGLPTGMINYAYPATVTPLLGTAGNPGKLIDAIPDSQPGGANELKNPIDNSTITTDALGNPRVNGALRDIGAVELYNTPVLTAKGADSTAILHWSRPDPGAGAFLTYYIVNYRETGSSPWLVWARHDTQLTEFVRNLSNGTSYDFRVAANTNLGQLPWSNVATATPNGPVHLSAARVGLIMSTLHFGNVPVGNSSSKSLVVGNTGNVNLTIGSITSDNSVFTVINDNCSLQTVAPTMACTLDIRFSPTAQGAVNGHILIPSNAATSPDKVGVSGIGDVASVFLSTAHLSFGDQLINTSSSPQTVTLTDNGGAPLTITSLASMSAEFVVSNDTCSGQTVNPGNQCAFDVHFTPTHIHGRSSSIAIVSSAASSPDNVTVDGTGLGSYAINASTGSLLFGDQPIHTSSQSKQIVLTNSGISPLTFSGISLPSHFSVTADTCTGQTVTSGNTCSISVVFSPNQLGLTSGNLQISSNHPDSPHAVFLAGTGVKVSPIPVNSKIALFILYIGLMLLSFFYMKKNRWV